MSQTLLAVLALGLLSLLVFGELQNRNHTNRDRTALLIREEARGLATGVFDTASGLPFDGSDSLTASGSFGPSGTIPNRLDSALAVGAFGDVDDLHGFDGTARIIVDHPLTGAPTPLDFNAQVAVEYVTETGSGWATSADTTRHKMVHLQLQHPNTKVTVDLQRLYSDFSL